jgi:hypothetical protein
MITTKKSDTKSASTKKAKQFTKNIASATKEPETKEELIQSLTQGSEKIWKEFLKRFERGFSLSPSSTLRHFSQTNSFQILDSHKVKRDEERVETSMTLPEVNNIDSLSCLTKESTSFVYEDIAVHLKELKIYDRGENPKYDCYGVWSRRGQFKLIFVNCNSPTRAVFLQCEEEFDVVENDETFNSTLLLELLLFDSQQPIPRSQAYIIQPTQSGFLVNEAVGFPVLYANAYESCDVTGYHDLSKSKGFVEASEFLGVDNLLKYFKIAQYYLLRPKLERSDYYYVLRKCEDEDTED